jgi:hypothetical protein
MITQDSNLVSLRDHFASQRMINEQNPAEAYSYADRAIIAREKNLSQIASYNLQKLVGEIVYLSITNTHERLVIKTESSSNRFSVDVLDTAGEKWQSLYNQVITFNSEEAIDQLGNTISIIRKIVFPS